MSKRIKTILLTALLIIFATVMQKSSAQSWNLTGNAGTNATTNFIGTTDAINLKIRTNNSVRMNITSSGKIAIGNITPLYKLDVKGGSINTDSLYRINGVQVINRNASDNVQIGDNAAKVGIGTASPAAMLDIYNSVGFANLQVHSSTDSAKIIIDRANSSNPGVIEYRTGGNNVWQAGTVSSVSGEDYVINNVSGGVPGVALRVFRSNNNVGIGNKLTVTNLGADVSGVLTASGLTVSGTISSNGETVNGNETVTGNETINGTIQIKGGSPAMNKVLTATDINGNATWQTFTATGVSGTGVANQVAFWNSVSSLSSNSSLYWDNTNSRIGIGTTIPVAKLQIVGGVASTLTSGGYIVAGPTTAGNVVIDDNGIQARNNASPSTLYLNADGGDVLVGLPASVDSKLYITGGSDATLNNSSGYMVIGSLTGANVVYDDNEIMARNNGAITGLAINNNGGNVAINGAGGAASNFGIGLSNPTFQLQLSTNSAAKPGTDVWTVASDARLKKNISDFNEGLEIVKKIHPVWFNYNGDAGMPTNERYVGTLAQDLQKIAPYMVKDWIYQSKNGEKQNYLAADYGAIDFILVNAIKEQQQQIDSKNTVIDQQQKDIDDLKTKFAEMENALSQCCTSFQPVVGSEQLVEKMSKLNEKALLEQNTPNPFSETTIIKFYIPQNTTNAIIKIYALDGSELKSIPVLAKGFGQTEISGKILPAGTYTYMLITDGKVVDTKQMVLTK